MRKMARVWRYWVIFLAAIYFIFAMNLPVVGQTTPPVPSQAACPQGYRPFVPGYNNTCLPHFPSLTVPDLFDGIVLSPEILSELYKALDVPPPREPVTQPGGLSVLPVVLLVDPPTALTASLGLIAKQALGRDDVKAEQIPALRNYLPNQLTGDFLEQAYSNNPFGQNRVDNVEPIRELLMQKIGEEAYRESGVGGVALKDVPRYARENRRDNPNIESLAQAMATSVGTTLLKYGINEALNALGISNLLPGVFDWFSKLKMGELFNLTGIPMSFIKNIKNIPVPIPVHLANIQKHDMARTGLIPMLSSIAGFDCDPSKDSTPADQDSEKGLKFDVLLFERHRVGVGGKAQCHDPKARGLLGALTVFRGIQSSKVYTVSNSIAEFIFSFAYNLTVEQISFEGRVQMCMKKKPLDKILGCSASAAFPAGIKLPGIPLAKSGIIFVPLQELLASILSMLPLTPEGIINTLAYLMQFIPQNEILNAITQFAGHLLPYVQPAQSAFQEAVRNGRIIDVPPNPNPPPVAHKVQYAAA